MLQEVEEYLHVTSGGVYCDCTAGAGGYAEMILRCLDKGRLVLIDRDREALDACRERFGEFGERVTFYHGSYGEIGEAVKESAPLAGIVADLGLSSLQLDNPARGFSFRAEGPLDMRMDRSRDLRAEQIVNYYDENQIADLIYQLGGEHKSRRIARAIVRERPVKNTRHLAEIVARAVSRPKSQKIHPATKTFQALRIAVNDEADELKKLLAAAPSLLVPQGRFVAVSFHSGEDRLVKQAFRDDGKAGVYEILTKGVVRPSDRETYENPPSRSAKLRAVRRTDQEIGRGEKESLVTQWSS